ncbi:MAG: patatin-like phospholipase family protein [Nitrososphaeraceae archaeon]|nr:patatin-like phospholipase family protein [Nitrososphaeraceae archaeon]
MKQQQTNQQHNEKRIKKNYQLNNNKNNNKPETVLIMQAGGSLGAYECGVCKALVKHGITKFDIIAGTSIGAINAAILAAGYTQDDGISNSVKTLEKFWLETMAEAATPSFLPYEERSALAAAYTFAYGNSEAYVPIWFLEGGGLPYFYYYLFNSPYLYSKIQMVKTLDKYVDFSKLRRKTKGIQDNNNANNNDEGNIEYYNNNNNNNNNNHAPRLILTCADIQKGEPVIFDSNDMDMDAVDVVASTGYALYGIQWTKKNDRYLWDGSLLHATPLRAVVERSPKRQKQVYVSDVFPSKQEKLPNNMIETLHRIRDMLFIDKSISEMETRSNILKKHLDVMDRMYNLLSTVKLDEKTKPQFKEIEQEYNNLANEHGQIMDKIIHIQRKERPNRHFIFEDADFSIATVRQRIKEGEEYAEEVLREEKDNNNDK